MGSSISNEESIICVLGCYLYPPEDSSGWHRSGIHLSDVWTLLPCCYDPCEFLKIASPFLRRACDFHHIKYSKQLFLAHGSFFQGKMVLQLSKEPSARLLKHVVRCYLRLSDNSRLIECFLNKPVQFCQCRIIIKCKKAAGDSRHTPDLVFGPYAEPEKLCGSASPISSKTPLLPKSWRMTPPPSVGWPSWWRTCRRDRSQIPEASLFPLSDISTLLNLSNSKNTSAELPRTAEPSVMDTDVFMRDCRRKKRLLPDYFCEQMCKLRACASVIWF